MTGIQEILAGYPALQASQEALYQDLHRNPELSLQETRTASKAAAHLRGEGYLVTA